MTEQEEQTEELPLHVCMYCGGDPLDITREIGRFGMVYVVRCPCDHWEVPGAKTPEEAEHLWRFGKKPGKS